MISAEKQLQLCAVVVDALELEPEARQSFLDKACESAEDRAWVESSLAEEEAFDDVFLEGSAIDQLLGRLWPTARRQRDHLMQAAAFAASRVPAAPVAEPQTEPMPWPEAPWAACFSTSA
ncbi:MAG: hypothetical protein AAF560_19145 [Acidobacteriota bacterium]